MKSHSPKLVNCFLVACPPAIAPVPVGAWSVHPAAAFQPQTGRLGQHYSLTCQKCIFLILEKGQVQCGQSKNVCCYETCIATLPSKPILLNVGEITERKYRGLVLMEKII